MIKSNKSTLHCIKENTLKIIDYNKILDSDQALFKHVVTDDYHLKFQVVFETLTGNTEEFYVQQSVWIEEVDGCVEVGTERLHIKFFEQFDIESIAQKFGIEVPNHLQAPKQGQEYIEPEDFDEEAWLNDWRDFEMALHDVIMDDIIEATKDRLNQVMQSFAEYLGDNPELIPANN